MSLLVLMIMRTMKCLGRLLLDALMSRELRMMWMRDDISYSSGRYAADTTGWWSTVNKTMIGDFKKFSHRLLLLRQRVHPALPSTVRTLARPKAQNQSIWFWKFYSISFSVFTFCWWRRVWRAWTLQQHQSRWKNFHRQPKFFFHLLHKGAGSGRSGMSMIKAQ